ncbi:hypothetical protein [Kineosporia sp. NBRC 101731]|uniref:hypothetical protein n=1 Tax=Kineosporia sp. NBRC 101731 TaxID=3032199 RepID=UPI0024A3E5CC|nr:hypothetical protein [Kineosporia sp. NBRC 101731]GLY32793.1 hypothetical protein Kisp02_61580 [Kineosporia sp. NBRC 101731]
MQRSSSQNALEGMDMSLGFVGVGLFFIIWVAVLVAIIALTVYGAIVTYRLALFYAQQQSPEQAGLIAAVATVASVIFGLAPVVGAVGLVLHFTGNLPYAKRVG